MPRLSNLNQALTLLNKTPILDLGGKNPMTVRSALVSICEMHVPKVPGTGESVRAFDLGARLFKAEESIELDGLEVEFLRQLLDESRIYSAIVIGTLNKYLLDLK